MKEPTETFSSGEIIGRSERSSSRWLRMVLLFGVTSLLSSVMLGHALGQETRRAALQGGRAISGLMSSHRSNAPQRLLLNGVELFVRTATVDAPVERVLARAHRSCVRGSGIVHGGGIVPEVVARLFGGDGVIDQRGDGDGAVACVTTPTPVTPAELSRGLERTAETGDLGGLGSFRYLYAREESGGRTAVLGLWSEGRLEVAGMFPAAGDAPGVDDPEVPRPQGSTRTLSVCHGALDLPLNVYRTPVPLRELRERYADDLRRSGLLVQSPEHDDGVAQGREQLWTVRSQEHTRFLAFVETGQSTWVVIMPLP